MESARVTLTHRHVHHPKGPPQATPPASTGTTGAGAPVTRAQGAHQEGRTPCGEHRGRWDRSAGRCITWDNSRRHWLPLDTHRGLVAQKLLS